VVRWKPTNSEHLTQITVTMVNGFVNKFFNKLIILNASYNTLSRTKDQTN